MATSTLSSGRWFGVLVLVQIVGLIAPFVMILPIVAERYWETASGFSSQIAFGVGWLLFNCALTVGISLGLKPWIKDRALSTTLLVLAVLMLALQIADAVHIFRMLSLSMDFASDGPRVVEMAKAAAATRAQVHHLVILSIDLWVLAMYATLIKDGLVPRWVALFGLATALMHTFAITVPLLIGASPFVPLGASMALGHLALAVTVMVKGLRPSD